MHPPAVRPALSRVGLEGVEAVVRLGVEERTAQPFAARIDCMVEPAPGRPAPGAPRFDDVVAAVIREVIVGAAGMRAERLVREVAERVRERLDAPRAEVAITARFPERRPAPVSGTPTQEISTLHAHAVATPRGTRRAVGVSAQGLTTAPHAQRVLAEGARERLAADGFTAGEIERALEHIPVATHDQRGTGTLHVGCPEDCALDFDVPALLDIVEGAMSSEIFELMKRSDEGAVVERAHRRPRTAVDCVRAMVAGAVERFAALPDAAFVSAAQESFETLHRHCVVAERAGRLGDLRRELETGEPAARPASLRAWLDAAGR
jgi:GTP cyclohydrolase I/GTP cyclohydrolase-4